MFIDDFIWLPDIIDKPKHNHALSPDEVEEVFFNRPRFLLAEKGRVVGEDMYIALGQTDTGRDLSVFFIGKPGNLALVVSARDMNRVERRRYGRK